MKNQKNLKVIVGFLAIIIIVLGIALSTQIISKNEMIERANRTYAESLASACYGLNANFEELQYSSKVYFYTKLTSSLQAAAAIFPQTQYAKNNRNFGYLLECLSQYFREQYESNGLDIVGERQMKLYNYLLDIATNPNDTKLMQELDEYIDSFDKPIRPDSPSHKMP